MNKNTKKYLFVFNDKKSGINAEVLALDMMEAQEKVCKLMGVSNINAPVFMTEVYDCPRCRNVECNYSEVD